jgi:hypothetical protein
VLENNALKTFGEEGVVEVILSINIDTKWRGVVSFTLQQIYPWKYARLLSG